MKIAITGSDLRRAYMRCLCGYLVGPKSSFSFMKCPHCGFEFQHTMHEFYIAEEAELDRELFLKSRKE